MITPIQAEEPEKEKKMHRYTIKYEDDKGEIRHEVFEGSDPGHAMEKAIKQGIKPISAMREGKFLAGYGFTEWQCPSTAKIVRLKPTEKLEQTVMDL